MYLIIIYYSLILWITGVSLLFVQEVSEVFQLGIFSFSYERKYEETMKTARQIDG